VDLDGHRVHPNPSGFIKGEKWLKSHFSPLINPDQINRVRCPIDLKSREMSELSYSFLIKSAIWHTH